MVAMMKAVCVAVVLAVLASAASAIRPKHSWDTLSNMSFFHACNESGLFSDRCSTMRVVGAL